MTNGYMRKASAIYQQNSVRGSVEGADSHQLIGMLLDGAIDRINQAHGHMTHGNVAGKGRCITGGLAIVGELRDSLDHKVDRDLSQRLDSLYQYVTRILLHAQLNNDPAGLDEAISLLTPIRDGWQAIRGNHVSRPQMASGAVR